MKLGYLIEGLVFLIGFIIILIQVIKDWKWFDKYDHFRDVIALVLLLGGFIVGLYGFYFG